MPSRALNKCKHLEKIFCCAPNGPELLALYARIYMSYSFDIKSSMDLLNELSRRVEDYTNDQLSSGNAVVCSILCWHVVDWIYNEYRGQLTEFKKITHFQEHIKSECNSLSYIQDVANGSKHRGITKYEPKVKSTEKHNGAFSSGFSKGFDISCLRMEIEGNQFVYFDEEIVKSLSFLKGYLNNLLVVPISSSI